MKTIFKYIIAVIAIQTGICTQAQNYNWQKLKKGTRIATAYTGLNYGLTYGVQYAQVMTLKKFTYLPLVEISLPLGADPVDDYNAKIGAVAKLYHIKKWVLSADILLINRQNKMPFATLQNIGGSNCIRAGYYSNKWFLAINVENDYAFLTHIAHTQAYKGNYADAQNGWYSNTAQNLLLGLNSGYSAKKIDITLNAGIIRVGQFTGLPTLPLYAKLGCNYRF